MELTKLAEPRRTEHMMQPHVRARSRETGLWLTSDPVMRSKSMVALKLRFADPIFNQKMSKRMADANRDPSASAARVAGIRKKHENPDVRSVYSARLRELDANPVQRTKRHNAATASRSPPRC